VACPHPEKSLERQEREKDEQKSDERGKTQPGLAAQALGFF